VVKEDFPALQGNIVYLDSAATTQKPRQVIEAIKEYYERYNANVHRGIYELARISTEIYEEAHEKVARFIGAKPQEIIFVKNCTEALNLVAQLLSQLVEGSNIVSTLAEHHSNLLPWWKLSKERGMELRLAEPDADGVIPEERITDLVDEETAIVAFHHSSNVSGHILDPRKVSKAAKKAGAFTVLDAAQSVPHLPVDVRELGVDAIAFSAHKMLGPMGIGVLWMREELLSRMEPVLLGGGIVSSVDLDLSPVWKDPPQRFEAGTPNVAGAYGFSAAIDYLLSHGVEKILPEERKLARALTEGLKERGFKVLGRDHTSIVSFWREDLDPHLLAYKLGREGVCVRSGYHCAEPLHRHLGISGTVRASLYLYNDGEDVERFFEALDRVM